MKRNNVLGMIERFEERKRIRLENWANSQYIKQIKKLEKSCEHGEYGQAIKEALGLLEKRQSLNSTWWERLTELRLKQKYEVLVLKPRQMRRAKWRSQIADANLDGDARVRAWKLMATKQIPKAARLMSQARQTGRKIAALCAKEGRKLAARTQKAAKDGVLRARRAAREMAAYWKRNEREERELRKRAEREALERRKAEEEARENRRQAKKLEFLLTQTELYSHFIARKADREGHAAAPQQLAAGVDFADIDDEQLRAQAERSAQAAVAAQRSRTRAFDQAMNPGVQAQTTEVRQPGLLSCTLKGYQLKGLGWLANLYEQGINGILADEMGLGKTVQAISLLAYLAEVHGLWGPFLVVAPASTLHNWQQELQRFVPAFRVLPYWGSTADRKTLRKCWTPRGLGRRDSPFHVLVTSYQLVVSDEKHFARMKWQYMVLDEAQAIKSSASQRWKTLLGFSCRNRLLLTGTPIQNSMQELWALLHFIMPGLFDSHDEFSEWFAKDIESHAENKGGLDERQLARLHMILKPFMIRRVKKDVEDELGAKIEVDVPCELTPRQQALYAGLSEKLPVDELLDQIMASDDSGLEEKGLMNVMMQLRKVCNHPELFERPQTRAPFVFAHDLRSTDGLWAGPSPSLLDVHVPKILLQPQLECPKLVDLPRLINCGEEPALELDIVPTSVRFLSERLASAYVPPAVAPPVYSSPVPSVPTGPLLECAGYSVGREFVMPAFDKLVQDSGKMRELDVLLARLFKEGHRVLIYNQMTRMIDLMEEYLMHKRYRYLRLDGSSRLSDRRDMVTDWQSNQDIFIFLLSTRAGGLGINLTAADTVIFYDSDWNPTVDQQAMDRAHRLGQTKQVTVYRLITKGTIEDRIRERAKQKDEIHKVVIAAGGFKQDIE